MFSFLARQFRSLAPIFRPPFDGLWVAVLLYFFWCFLVHPNSQILRGNLPDPDDYMYLAQVLDWLKGQSWFDNVQHRLDPPMGALVPFSRLAQLPMAAFIWLFERLGLPSRGAATLTALLEPLALFAGFLAAFRWTASSLMPKDWSSVTAYVVLFAGGLMMLFVPGHLDHHGLEILLVALALGCTLHMVEKPEEMGWGIGAGFSFALGLAISLEILPWVILVSGWIGLWAMAKGRAAARNGLAYGLALDLACAAFLVAMRRPADWLTPDLLVYSYVYVLFANGIALALAGIALTARARPILRWSLGIGLAVLAGFLFLKRFPMLITGPYGGMDPALAKIMLDDLTESMPLLKVDHSWLKILIRTLYGWLGLGAGIWFLRRASAPMRWRWGLIVLLLAVSIPMTVFYQFRFIANLGMFAALPLAALLQRGWKWIGTHEQGRRKVWAEIGLLLLVGPLPGVLAPALVDGRSFNGGVLLFPAESFSREMCDMVGLEQVLWSKQLYDGTPRTIMNTMGIGPELLFRTPHMVLSAPFHTSVEGNLDAVRFFSTSDPAEALAIARRRHVDLVVTCILIPGMYNDFTKTGLSSLQSSEAKKDDKLAPPLIARLVTGRQLPEWLVPVRSPVLHNYVVYEIAPTSRAKKSPARD
jgi:hypothetical protein